MAILCGLLLLVASGSSDARSKSSQQGTKVPDYSKEAFVVERIFTKVGFENDGTYSLEETVRARIQSQAGLQGFGVLNIAYPSATSTMDIAYVRVTKADGRVVETPPENILDMPSDITREAPFYSDIKEKHIAVKGLEIGDVLEYQSRESVKTPLDPGQFWFAHDFFEEGICLQEKLQISVPRGRNVKVASSKIQPATTEEGSYKIYSWTTANLESSAAKKESKTAEAGEPAHHSVQVTTFQDWDAVGQWIKSLVAPRAVATPQVRAKADELTRNAKTDAEKTQLIYDYVSTKFRYIGISLGIGRYQPHAAADVLSNDYGDCKDKHTLFAALLAAENIKAYPALINSSTKIDPNVPSPGQFDHIITAIPQGDGFLFLDTTPEVAPFGYLVNGLRDKEALVIPDSGPARLVRTAKDLPFKSKFDFQADGTLDDSGTLEAKMQFSVRGDAELFYRQAFRRAGQSQWNAVMQEISSRLGFGGTVADVTVSAPEATDAPFHVSYSYTRKTYGDWDNRRVPPPFPYIFLPAAPEDKDKKSSPIKMGVPTEFVFRGTMKLPANSDPHIPARIELHDSFADYQSSSSVSNGTLKFERSLVTKTNEITVPQIDAYTKFVKAVADDYGSMIPLRSGDDGVVEESADPDVRALVTQGYQEWQARNFPGAANAFQQAVDKDPKYSQGWLALGGARLAMGDVDQAIEDMKKGIALDPTRTAGYKYLAATFTGLRRDDDALQVWKDLEKVDPADPDASRAIAQILIGQKRYAEAVTGLESALKQKPDDGQLLLELGSAYLNTGNKEKGIAALQAAAATPALLNDVAYTLAENNLQLNDALRYAQKAVAAIESDTAAISLDGLSLKDVQTVPVLAAAWDTLGWVHFRLGQFDEAEKYLSAGWNLTQDPVIADHLGQVYQKQGKKHQAAVAYSRAIAAGHAPAETEGRLETLRAGGKPQPGEQVDALTLQNLRMLKLEKFAGKPKKHASAEFFLLIGPGPKITGAKFISGSEELRDAGNTLAAAKVDVLFPDDHPVQILRRGILDCEPEVAGCMFVMIPPGSVHAVK